MTREQKRRLTGAALVAWMQVRRYWGSPVGVHLVACYYKDDPWIAAGEMSKDLDLSEDTVRRKLEELATIGRVDTRRRGRTTYYRARKAWAEKTVSTLNRLVSAAKCE